jgi:hypothetical protein
LIINAYLFPLALSQAFHLFLFGQNPKDALMEDMLYKFWCDTEDIMKTANPTQDQKAALVHSLSESASEVAVACLAIQDDMAQSGCILFEQM